MLLCILWAISSYLLPLFFRIGVCAYLSRISCATCQSMCVGPICLSPAMTKQAALAVNGGVTDKKIVPYYDFWSRYFDSKCSIFLLLVQLLSWFSATMSMKTIAESVDCVDFTWCSCV